MTANLIDEKKLKEDFIKEMKPLFEKVSGPMVIDMLSVIEESFMKGYDIGRKLNLTPPTSPVDVCTACYGKGTYSIFEGPTVASADFPGDKSYLVDKGGPKTYPCKRCNGMGKETSPAVKGVDELEAQLNQAQNNAEIWTAIWAIYDYLKQTPVAKEDMGKWVKHIMLQPGEYYKDEFGNIITYEDEQKERLKDFQPKEEVEIKPMGVFHDYTCPKCGKEKMDLHFNYCSGCGSKIKRIA